VGLFDKKKTRGQKSRDTVLLRRLADLKIDPALVLLLENNVWRFFIQSKKISTNLLKRLVYE
jgi:hypothetical protein